MEKTEMVKELDKARERLFLAQAMLENSSAKLAYAEKLSMKATAVTFRARVARYQLVVDRAKKVVEELEKATGALPLKT